MNFVGSDGYIGKRGFSGKMFPFLLKYFWVLTDGSPIRRNRSGMLMSLPVGILDGNNFGP